MRQQRRQFSPEFKADAVAPVRSSGRPIAAIAHELGIGESNLSYWLKRTRRAVLELIRAGLRLSRRRHGRTLCCAAGRRSWRWSARS